MLRDTYTINGLECPPETIQDLKAWALTARPCSSFLEAVLTNDLFGACKAMDDRHVTCIFAVVGYVYNEMPAECHGSVDLVNAWAARGGLEGMGIVLARMRGDA